VVFVWMAHRIAIPLSYHASSAFILYSSWQ
jgi:hypothetical protein